MSTEKSFDLFNVPLPALARSLCQEVRDLATERLSRMGKNEITELDEELLEEVMKTSEQVDPDTLDRLGPELFNLYDLPADVDALTQMIDERKKAGMVPEGFLDQTEATDNAVNALVPIMALLVIQHMYETEKVWLACDSDQIYVDYAGEMDGAILGLHQLAIAMKTMDPALEKLVKDLERREGAKKGGAAKAERTRELKEVVIEEARAKHPDKPAAEAARDIYRSLSKLWLLDEEEQPLLLDPVNRFAQWIRQSRRSSTT